MHKNLGIIIKMENFLTNFSTTSLFIVHLLRHGYCLLIYLREKMIMQQLCRLLLAERQKELDFGRVAGDARLNSCQCLQSHPNQIYGFLCDKEIFMLYLVEK
jgi:hypothetical protein